MCISSRGPSRHIQSDFHVDRVLDISVARQVYNYHLRRPLIPACALRYTIIACSTAAFLTIRLKYRTYTLNRIRRLSYTHVYLNLHLKTT